MADGVSDDWTEAWDEVSDDGSDFSDGLEDSSEPLTERVVFDHARDGEVLKAAGVELEGKGVVSRARAGKDDEVGGVVFWETFNEIPDSDSKGTLL